MLSPKVQRMQRSIRINEGQLLGLAEKARYDSRLAGVLHKRCADSNKWLLRWFRLYQVNSFSLITVFENKKRFSLTFLVENRNFVCLSFSFSWLLSGGSWVRARRARELSWQFNFEKGKQKRRKHQLSTKSRASFFEKEEFWGWGGFRSSESNFINPRKFYYDLVLTICDLVFFFFSESPVLLRQRTVFETHWGYFLRRMFLWTCYESGHSSGKIRPKQTQQWKNGKKISFLTRPKILKLFLYKRKTKKMSNHLFSISVLLRNYVSTWKPTAIWIEGWHCLRM